MAARLCVFALVSLIGTMSATELRRELIVWNVGQGQWVTFVEGGMCWHVDMGGEFAPWPEIQHLCRARENVVSLSHWDRDHISFAGAARTRLPHICLLNRPEGVSSVNKSRMIDALPHCTFHSPFAQWSDPAGKTANAKSWVVEWHHVLAPGDSPRGEEARWIWHLPLDQVTILVLGHHGSRTSTSPELLAHLPALREAVSSARFRRYGHPHVEVVEELRRAHVPLLRTEEWGTIHFAL